MSILQAVGLTILPNVGGILGGLITKQQVPTWYKTLDKPSWRPPNWLFGPVWTGLYSMMGYASYMVLRDGVGSSRDTALMLYGSQLALNWAWTPIFFGSHKLGLAFVEIVAMWANIVACTYAFYPINKTAAYMMLPYLAWVSFATCLNFSIWQRNKSKNSD